MKRENTNEKINPLTSPSLKSWGEAPDKHKVSKKNVIAECGWGRLVFGHSFKSNTDIADVLRDEKADYRDLAIYLRDPHVVVAKAPQELFIDPSYTYRLLLDSWKSELSTSDNYTLRKINAASDIEEINRIYLAQGMVKIDREFLEKNYKGQSITYWVAEDTQTKKILGVAMALDHKLIFSDPENGSSLWALAVDPQATHPGIGMALVSHLADFFKKKGRSFMDISVMHNNKEAIALYENLGFQRVPVFCIKNKNAINESLFTKTQPDEESLNPYAMIIVDEARRRGIKVEILDPIDNYFKLSFGGRSVVCRESLTELTSSSVKKSFCGYWIE